MQFIGNQYFCWNPILTSDGNLTDVLSVTGEHLSDMSNADVKAFYVEDYSLHLDRIPRKLEEYFPSLIAFLWVHGRLSTISVDDLKPFPELQLFSVFNNRLTSLDDNLFLHNPMLVRISFRQNALEFVGEKLLAGLDHLTSADFQGNICTDMQATTRVTVEELVRYFIYNCPLVVTTTETSTTTTQSAQCSTACVELIEALKEENGKQNKEIARQAEEIARHSELNSKQQDEIVHQGNAIKELERIVGSIVVPQTM